MMQLYSFLWHLVTVYVIAESREEALTKIRDPESEARRQYPLALFDDEPDHYEESTDGMMCHYGWD